MKLIRIVPALVALAGLACAPLTLSAQTTNAPAAAAPAKAKTKSAKTPYSGSITALDTTANTITVASSTKTLTLAVAPTTKILKDKVVASLTDLAVGEKVTGSYTKDAAGKLTAASIHYKSMAAKPATAAPAPAPAQ